MVAVQQEVGGGDRGRRVGGREGVGRGVAGKIGVGGGTSSFESGDVPTGRPPSPSLFILSLRSGQGAGRKGRGKR